MTKLLAAVLLLAAACLSACATHGPKLTGNLLARDGVRVAWEGRGKGAPAIVLVHCWCGNRDFWKGQVDELARDHEVILLDLPGHGASGRDRERYTIEGLGADVAELVEALKLERVVLVGHSMGGPVCLAAASRLRGRVVGIVGVDNLHDADRGMTAEMIEPMAARFEADFAGAMQAAMTGMLPQDADPELKRWIVDQALRTDQKAAIELLRGFATLDVPRLLREAGAPVRCINSAGSPWPTNIAGNRKYADYDAVIVEGVGHFPQLEQPERFNETLKKVLERLEERR